MGNNSANMYDEPLVSEEQEGQFVLIEEIAQQIEMQIKSAREKAKCDLLDSSMTSWQKQESLNAYFDFRMNPKSIVTVAQNGEKYCLCDIPVMAKVLYEDETFPYGDSDFVLNWLAFWEDSFNFDDEILAFHQYRLEKTNKNLSYLTYILGVYISQSLRISFDEIKEFDVAFELTKEKSIKILNNLIYQVEDILKKCKRLIQFNSSRFSLSENEMASTFSNRMDFDAGADVSRSIVSEPDPFYEEYFGHPEPQKNNEETEKKLNEIDAWYNLTLLSQCIRSVYLLSSTIDVIGRSAFSNDAISLITKCRRMCDKLFDDEDNGLGAYDVITSEKILCSDKLESEEKNQDSKAKDKLFQSYLDLETLEIIESGSIEEVLQRRTEWLKNAKANYDGDTIELLEQKVSWPISCKLIELTSSQDSLAFFKEKVKILVGENHHLLNEDILNTLATAELLYDEYAVKKPTQGFDYSGISALYYQALEGTYNSLFWRAYADYLNVLSFDNCSFTTLMYNYKKQPDTRAEGYLPTSKDGIQNKNYLEFDNKNKRCIIKEYCMFGSFGKLLDLIDKYKAGYGNLKNFFSRFFGYANENEMFDDETFLSQLNCFKKKFNFATGNRNSATHGTDAISKEQCTRDKLEIISEERQNSIGLIKQFLQLFTKRELQKEKQ